MSGRVQLTLSGAHAVVTLDNLERMNAMTVAMWHDLAQVFERVAALPEVRLVVVRGQGKHFCAGGDISEYPGFRFTEQGLTRFHEEQVWVGLDAILNCPVPVIAVIEGNCMGAGLEIASCCDVRLASEDSRFGAPIAKLGFPMAPRELRLVASRLGTSLAADVLLAAQILAAPRLYATGFLHALASAGALQELAQQKVTQMLQLAPHAARMNKHGLRCLQSGDEAAWARWAEEAYGYASSPEHREGISAFLEKRPPRFSQG